MHHAETAPQPGSWQEMAGRLTGLVTWHVARLCRVNGIPPGQRDDVVGEALVALCVGVKSAFARGVAGVDCKFYAMNGLAAVLRTRWGRRPRLLADLFEDPGAALAARGPGPVEELEAREALQALLARLPGERLRQVVYLRAEGLAVREVAERVGLSRQRVEQLLQEARAVLLAR
jgi:RNA polymerase sigma factor (sigma-70 family)